MRKLALILSAFAFVLVASPAFPASAANRKADEKAVLEALDAWKAAMLKQDRAALEKIFHPDLSYAHSSAQVQTKEQAIPGAVNGAGWEAIEFTDTTVRFQGNVAIVNGKTDMHQRNKGKPTTISKLIVLSVWVKAPRLANDRPPSGPPPDDDQVIAAHAAMAALAAKPPAAAVPAAPAK